MNKSPTKFSSGQEMYDFLYDDRDLYNPQEEIYVYRYNSAGSINVYTGIDPSYAEELDKGDEYWAAYLGWHGSSIYDNLDYKKEINNTCDDVTDDALAWCESMYKIDGWLDVTK